MTELAQRAVACKGWRWMPGMLTLPFHEDDDRSLPECHPAWRVSRAGIAAPWAHDPTWGALPDLSDPATLGCVLALVREAWDVGYGENKYAYIAVNPPVTPHMDEPWNVVVCDHNGEWPFGFDGDTEAEALVAALEAAP